MFTKVKILKDCSGSPDGVSAMNYFKGDEKDLPQDLADAFISMGVCEEVTDENLDELEESEAEIKERVAKEKAAKVKAAKLVKAEANK